MRCGRCGICQYGMLPIWYKLQFSASLIVLIICKQMQRLGGVAASYIAAASWVQRVMKMELCRPDDEEYLAF